MRNQTLFRFNDMYFSEMFHHYQVTRSKGLKKQGNKMLEELMLYFDQLSQEDKEAICYELCRLREKGELKTLQYPLSRRVCDILRKDCQENKMPQLRWYYEITNDTEILEKAYHHPDCDDMTVKLMGDYYLYYLWYGSHHMPDYCLLENEQESSRVLQQLSDLIKKHNPLEFTKEYLYYRQLYSDWWLYQLGKYTYSFAEWCTQHNRNYTWIKAYYYN